MADTDFIASNSIKPEPTDSDSAESSSVEPDSSAPDSGAPDFIELIEQGVARWNQWRKNHPTIQPDLSHAYLFGQSLAGFNLSGVNFERTCLIGAKLRGANLQNARLQATYASSADFSEADLRNARLDGSSFGEADFTQANLSATQAYAANFGGATFTGADLSAWKIDKTTVLASIKATHIYLAADASPTKQPQRQPKTGTFQPGALEPFLQLVALQQSAIPTPIVTTRFSSLLRIGDLLDSQRFRFKEVSQFRATTAKYISTVASAKTVDNIQQFVRGLTNPEKIKHLSRQTSVELRAFYVQVAERLSALSESAAMHQFKALIKPDSAEQVTAGVLHQLSPETIERINRLLQKESMGAVQKQAHQSYQQLQLSATSQLSTLAGSTLFAPVRTLANTPAAKRMARPFQPDSVSRVTPGAITRQDLAALKAETFTQIKHLFTPDAADRVTVGALHQLSPDTVERLNTLLRVHDIAYVANVMATQAKQTHHRAKAKTVYQAKVIARTPAFTRTFTQVRTLVHSPAVNRVTHPFKPDSPYNVTPGALNGLLTEQVRADALGQIRTRASVIATDHFSPPAFSRKVKKAGHLAKKVSDPKYLEATIKAVCEEHPWPTGLSATAVLALLAVNFAYRPVVTTDSAPRTTAASAESAQGLMQDSMQDSMPPDSMSDGLASPTASQEPAVLSAAIEVASVAMPCQGIVSPVRLDKLEEGYQYESGAIYYGAIENGQPADGAGTMVYPTGNRYDGEYKDGQREGCGTFTFANDRRYIGQFKADKFDGLGTWVIENGERYIGEFESNQCSGQGTFIFANGSSKSGVWQQGKLPNTTLSCDRGSLDLPSSQDM
ncbi:MAG: pentapeptide repeat-containing protein [Cyanobacteria bacterium J06634_5]